MHIIDEHIKTNGADMIEKYFQEHGTYNGIEEYIKSIENQPDKNNH